ncbi:ATP-binding cassette sub-family A member 1 [Eumeta japonica]|uniref:ATP-binding cassette sub-family A member 1 n=1 Tax=Eumeta variegata TaxID=151549 RepID=A0A4C1VVZ9_EUMVA|nr:ATP-binding cassette sub-family A member 1 [Eumeta japonica]
MTVVNSPDSANSSFALMSELADIVHSFAGSFDAVESIAEHKDSVGVLRTLMNSANFREMMKAMTGGDGASTEANVPNVNIDEVFESFGDIKDIGNFLRRASDLLRCVNLNRFHAMPSEDQLSHEAVKLTRVNEFAAGLVFTETEMHGDSPVEVEYKIRMDIDSVPTTTRKRNQFWTPGPEASFLEDMRYFRGFVQIQDMIDKAIIELSANLSKKIVKRDVTSIKDNKWAVYTQQVPYPCYRRDYFQSSLYESQALIVALFFSLMLTVSSAIRFIVSEKEAGITMLLSVMGVSFRNQALSWFVATFVEMVVTVTGMLAALKLGGVLPHSDPSLLWLIMLNFGLSVVMFCYLMSKFFKSSSLGAVCAVLVYLVSFMPYVIILALEAALTETEKVVTSLSMSTAFCYSILYVARYEAVGAGAHWHNVWNSPTAGDRMSIASTSIIVLFDSILYFVIACLIDKFFGPKTLKSNINKCTTTSEKAGVSIIGITKVYAEKSRRPKVALDNVSIELHKGQITTLLGHNGAGKTTLIKIITGMLKPSKGHVIVRAESGDGGATRLGVCPQHDVLFENMTTVEHLTLYARLKSGLPLGDVKSEIQNMLKLLSFGVLAYEQARRLSGGLRRRLCVALAFVAQPQLVLLDEPSSGVDPLARRDIWSLIVRLKEDRTVLLTTHHLDEAELLSDQIVIVHRGQIHTVGSPVEIKRSLGNGYKLTVTYPRKVPSDMQTPERYDVWNEELDRTVSVEERSKRLVGAVAGAVRNARVEDVDRFQVVMLIPFFDADGLNNDLLHLCTVLESRQEELGFSSYNLDCSSLEQVFFNICQQADRAAEGAADGETAGQINEAYDTMSSSSSRGIPSKSTSTASLKNDNAPLVPDEGQIRGTGWEQFLTLLHKRWIHYSRNTWLLFLLLALPTLFVAIAMGFSLIRPPADNEIALKLDPDLYHGSTEFLIPTPTTYDDNTDPAFAENVMSILTEGSSATNWSAKDSPVCRCTELRQECDYTEYNEVLPKMLLLPNTSILNDWLIKTQEIYIEKRYGGWSSSLKNNISNFVAWYNNKGHHAMPSYVNSLNSAVLRAVSGGGARITTYTHPLKISEEQLSKSTVLQHVADAGIAGMLLLAVSLVPAGGAVYLVLERTSQQKRLQLLSGVTPAVYWAATLTWDMIVSCAPVLSLFSCSSLVSSTSCSLRQREIMLVNVGLTCAVLLAFGLPVFVARENLPAICLLLILFGFSCSSLVHVLEKLFTEASMANMILFCGNVFLGLSGLALLLILDIISESEASATSATADGLAPEGASQTKKFCLQVIKKRPRKPDVADVHEWCSAATVLKLTQVL